jgi:competence protein ComEA
MPTPAERNALIFLAAVAVIGVGARAVSASRFAHDARAARHFAGAADTGTLGERALAAQIAAVDSAQSARASSARDRSTRRRAPRVAGAAGIGRRRRAGQRDSPATDSSFDLEMPRLSHTPAPTRPPPVVDVNRATQAELERLPRVGPALASRIIAWRQQHGPFRSLDDLRHVHGIGAATVALLAPAVTF